MTFDFSTTYLGLSLAHPILPAASPATGDIDRMHALVEAGAPALVLPSLFEEQIEHDAMAVHYSLELGADGFGEAPVGFFPRLDDYNTGPEDYLRLIRRAKGELHVPIIASLNGVSAGGWTRYAEILSDQGIDALELNTYRLAPGVEITSSQLERSYLDLVETIRASVDIPLAVKVGPYFSSMGEMARRLVDAGADGLVMFNRFYQPDIDLETLRVVPSLVLSDPVELRLVLRWLAILHGRVDCDLAATSGVHQSSDAIKAVLAGARGSLTFTSEPLAQDTLFLGLPELQLNASVTTAEILHLTATLFRERVTGVDEEGNEIVEREPMNFCAIQPMLRFGVATPTPVIPTQEMELPLQCFTSAHWVPAGQRLVLEVATRSPHHATFGIEPNITVFTGPDRTAYGLPLVEDAVLHDDVPIGDRPAAPPSGTPTDFFFHGEVPEAEKAGEFLGLTPGPTFDQEEPTGQAPKFQTGGWYGNDEFAANPLLAYWRAPFEGTIQGDVDVQLFASSPTMTVAGELTVTLFDASSGQAGVEAQPIGRATVSTAGVGPTPTPVEVTIPNVAHTLSDGRDLVVQVSTQFIDVGYFKVWYDSVELPAGITLPILDDDES